MIDLDRLVARGRDARVRDDVAADDVRQLERWARTAATPTRRWAWFAGIGGALAAAATVLGLVLWGGGRTVAPRAVETAAATAAVRIGDRVAIVAAAGTTYRVVHADAAETTIAVDRGAVTARLWHGDSPHHLRLVGGGVVATAHGTIYSLAIAADGAGVVHVDEGTVEVARAGETHAVRAGETLPATGGPAAPSPDALLAMAALVPDAIAPVDAPAAAVAIDAAIAAPIAPIAPAPHPVASGKDLWHQARLLRGQGKFADAIAACLAIADLHDTTWSPIALVEAVRIYAGPLADPEHAIAIADRMVREWPGDPLVAEGRALRCHALAELARPCD